MSHKWHSVHILESLNVLFICCRARDQGVLSLKFRSSFLSTDYTHLGVNLPPKTCIEASPRIFSKTCAQCVEKCYMMHCYEMVLQQYLFGDVNLLIQPYVETTDINGKRIKRCVCKFLTLKPFGSQQTMCPQCNNSFFMNVLMNASTQI